MKKSMLFCFVLLLLCATQLIFAQSDEGEVIEETAAPAPKAKPLPAPITEDPKKIVIPRASSVLMVDDFEDGDYISKREWWNFGDIQLSVIENEAGSTPAAKKVVGKKSLRTTGMTNQWMFGGIGCYIGKSLIDYNALKLVVYSPVANSAMINIEVFDDDNGNTKVDLNANGKPNLDDVFSYHLLLDFQGWRVITIPFSEFEDSNPGVGDGIWNPYESGSSIGSIQLQMVFFTPKGSKGNLDVLIDTVKFVQLNAKQLQSSQPNSGH